MKIFYTAAVALMLAATGASAAESVPYSHTFDNANCLDGWTTPANTTMQAFKYCESTLSPYAISRPGAGTRNITSTSEYSNKNSWLISPAISLEGGREYKVTYTYAAENQYNIRTGIFFGTAPDPAAMTNPALPGEGYTLLYGTGFQYDQDFMTAEATIKPAASGDYYVGLVDATDRYTSGRFLITKITVTAAAAGTAPGEATEFTVTPDAGGRLSVSLSAIAPTVNASGNTLTSISSLTFLREGQAIHTVSNPVPGRVYTYVDNAPRNGNNTYGVQAHNADGPGNVVSKTVNVGVNAPARLTNVTAAEANPGYVTLTWTKPERDEKSNLLDPDLVTVKINVYQGTTLVKTVENIAGNQTTIQVNDGESGGTYRFELFAVTTGGESIPVETSDVTLSGKAVTLPYFENFAGGEATQSFSVSSNETYTSTWQFVDVNGTGVARFYGSGTNAQATLYSGLIELPADERISISFKYSGYSNNSNFDLTLLVHDGESWTEVKTYEATTADFQIATEDLSAYAGKTIRYGLRGKLRQGYYMFVTDIAIDRGASCDLGFESIDFPNIIERCIAAEGKLVVKNYGSEAVSSYTVDLYRNGERVAAKTGNALAAGATEEVVFDLETDVNSLEQYTYHAVINLDGDDNTGNNTSARTVVYVTTPEFEPALNARVEMSDEDTVVTLKWDEPIGSDPESTSPWRRLVGYNVYRNGEPVNGILLTECQLIEADLEPGTYNYTVEAVYVRGNSELTTPVTAVVKEKNNNAIDSIAADALDANALYFDLQGRRVAKPAAGMLLVKVADGEATRVLVK